MQWPLRETDDEGIYRRAFRVNHESEWGDIAGLEEESVEDGASLFFIFVFVGNLIEGKMVIPKEEDREEDIIFE